MNKGMTHALMSGGKDILRLIDVRGCVLTERVSVGYRYG